jgi:ABC-type Fe3+/spermidine/putrescine transport system ATPase subunit
MTSGVRLSRIAKNYGRTAVLRGIDLDIVEGEFLSVLGPSGSGKTTILKILAGFEEPDAGSVSFAGRDMSGIPPERRNIGVVFQNYSLFPHLSVADNVGFPLRMRGMAKVRRGAAIRAALGQVALTGFEHRMPSQLSGGQQQRVAIARAIVYQPDFLLMDEPLGALDRRLRGDMQTEIKALHERLGITVVYVTHDQDEALSMSDRVVVLNAGRIEQVGPPREVYRNPASLFVADFLGDSMSLSVSISDGLAQFSGLESTAPLRLPSGVPIVGAAKLLWRSDQVAIGEPDGASPDILKVPATVLTAAYAGSAVRVRVRLASGDIGTVATDEARRFSTGEAVLVLLDPRAASILPVVQ